MQLTQIAREKWIAEYVFQEPIQSLKFKKVGDYRSSAWKPITPGVTFQVEGDGESFSAPDGIRNLRLEISAYGKFEPKNYAPNIRFSDGGANIYMGFFQGFVSQGSSRRDLALELRFQALPGETVIATPKFENSDKGNYAYAYFGPQQAVARSNVQMIIDPALPVWIRDKVLNTSDLAARYFETRFQHKLSRQLSLTAAASEFESNGFSFKGGATNGQINYRISGKLVQSEDPTMREKLGKLVALNAAHEMAHIWQNDVSQGGIGGTAPWIHEGGAELLAADSLLKTGIWSQSDYDDFVTKTMQECKQLKEAEDAYRYSYACGLYKFVNYNIDISTLWKALRLETERTGEKYSESMVERVLTGLRATVSK